MKAKDKKKRKKEIKIEIEIHHSRLRQYVEVLDGLVGCSDVGLRIMKLKCHNMTDS